MGSGLNIPPQLAAPATPNEIMQTKVDGTQKEDYEGRYFVKYAVVIEDGLALRGEAAGVPTGHKDACRVKHRAARANAQP